VLKKVFLNLVLMCGGLNNSDVCCVRFLCDAKSKIIKIFPNSGGAIFEKYANFVNYNSDVLQHVPQEQYKEYEDLIFASNSNQIIGDIALKSNVNHTAVGLQTPMGFFGVRGTSSKEIRVGGGGVYSPDCWAESTDKIIVPSQQRFTYTFAHENVIKSYTPVSKIPIEKGNAYIFSKDHELLLSHNFYYNFFKKNKFKLIQKKNGLFVEENTANKSDYEILRDADLLNPNTNYEHLNRLVHDFNERGLLEIVNGFMVLKNASSKSLIYDVSKFTLDGRGVTSTYSLKNKNLLEIKEVVPA
jgi:hypothetical protein